MSGKSQHTQYLRTSIIAGRVASGSRQIDDGEPPLWLTVSVWSEGEGFVVNLDYYRLAGVTGDSVEEVSLPFATLDEAFASVEQTAGLALSALHF